MLLLAVIAILYIKTSACLKAIPGQPVPNAEVLDEIFSKFLGDSYNNNALFNFILGGPSDNKDTNLTNDNLDIKILDVENVRKIIRFAKNKHIEASRAENTRRQDNRIPFDWHPYIIHKAFDMMKQTIYLVKERMNVTLPFREKYVSHHSYRIAVLYGAGAAILGKMESLLAQMKHFYWRTHFIWWLIIYEKLLACNIDISNLIEDIFIIQKAFAKMRGPKPKAHKFDINQMKMKPNIPKDAFEHAMQQNG